MLRSASFALMALGLVFMAQSATSQHNCCSCPAVQSCDASAVSADTTKQAEPVFQKLPGAGKKVWIGDSHYFTYKFDKTPKIGVVVLKVQLFTKKGVKDRSFEIAGISDMPSMRGGHHTEGQFKVNRLGDYLLPINFTTRGEWKIRLVFNKGGESVYRGAFIIKV